MVGSERCAAPVAQCKERELGFGGAATLSHALSSACFPLPAGFHSLQGPQSLNKWKIFLELTTTTVLGGCVRRKRWRFLQACRKRSELARGCCFSAPWCLNKDLKAAALPGGDFRGSHRTCRVLKSFPARGCFLFYRFICLLPLFLWRRPQ